MINNNGITIVGLGPGAYEHISLQTIEEMQKADEVILRTYKHPCVDYLSQHNIKYITLDYCYENDDFESVYQKIVDICLDKAQDKKIVYAVPGSPQVAEKTVVLLRKQAKEKNIPLKVFPAISFLDIVFSELNIDPIDGICIVDALGQDSLNRKNINMIVGQIYDRTIASDVKISLMDIYGDDYKVVLLQNLGLPEQKIIEIPLLELDRQKDINHLTCLYVPKMPNGNINLNPLIDTIEILRSPGGCPWDIEQDHKSLRQNLIEEAYEVIDAIDNEDEQELCDELGDLLLQVVFHARIAEENNLFSMQDVVDKIVQKMHTRHPHVFGEITVENSQQVLDNWEKIKKEQYKDRKNVLDGIPRYLPALLCCQKIQSKVAKVGFDWQDISPVWDKITEEIVELRQAIKENDKKEIEHELGDVIFSIVNLARHLKVSSEVALNMANKRFKQRFSYVEKQVEKSGKTWKDFSLEQLDEFWNRSKIKESELF